VPHRQAALADCAGTPTYRVYIIALCALRGWLLRVEDSDCIFDCIAAALIEGGGKACVKLGWAGVTRPHTHASKSPPQRWALSAGEDDFGLRMGGVEAVIAPTAF